ncbi:MAG: glutamyl-tRNA reductase [Verrucomicrobiota bacterium]
MSLILVGLNHRSAPLEVRERFAFAERDLPETLAASRESGLVRELVLVSTCNRVEAYAAVAGPVDATAASLRRFLQVRREVSPAPGDCFYVLHSAGAARHLARVAAGLDSLVLGETEILGQLKQAYEIARRAGSVGRVLHRTFQQAFAAARQARQATAIQRGNLSVASVAVDLADRLLHGLDGRQVMILGAGDTSEKTARALLGRGARSVFVSNRSFDRAATLATALGGTALHFDQWTTVFPRIDIIISSTSAPHLVVTRDRLQSSWASRPARPLLLIDLAVPRDIEPGVAGFPGVHLYNVDQLQAAAEEAAARRRAEIPACEAILDQHLQRLQRPGWEEPRPAMTVAA